MTKDYNEENIYWPSQSIELPKKKRGKCTEQDLLMINGVTNRKKRKCVPQRKPGKITNGVLITFALLNLTVVLFILALLVYPF